MDQQPLLDPAGIGRLREALSAAGYTLEGLSERLGEDVAGQVEGGDIVPALRALGGDDPLATLLATFTAGRTVTADRMAAALAPLPLADALAAGLVERHGDGVRAALSLEVYGPWWLLADLAPPARPIAPDHVLGITGSALALADYTVRRPVGTALDLCTGDGIEALHLSQHADRVTGTDLLPRALRLAATTAALNGLDWELLAGDMFAPVAGRRFDLVVANPPFIVKPGTPSFVYRDGGRPGDSLVAEMIAAAPDVLTPGGHMQFEGEWAHRAGADWAERLAGLAADAGLDAWIVEANAFEPKDYVEHWATSPEEDTAGWLEWLHAEGIESLGWGVVTLRNSGHASPTVRVERREAWPRFGGDVAAWFARQDWLRAHRSAPELLAARYEVPEDVTLHVESVRAGQGWAVDGHRLSTAGSYDRTPSDERVPALAAALVGACDDALPLSEHLARLAGEQGRDVAGLVEEALPLVPELVEGGFLHPVGMPGLS
ncbi:methyltransferase [Longispora sp. NPDC051575]|uniref:DUF7059 domain-containing protein n=1 Tax=Longispora sp. NPDC051575 TaxID=3154943 RepID=UPI00341C4503